MNALYKAAVPRRNSVRSRSVDVFSLDYKLHKTYPKTPKIINYGRNT